MTSSSKTLVSNSPRSDLQQRQQDRFAPWRCSVSLIFLLRGLGLLRERGLLTLSSLPRPHHNHTELEEELHETAHIDYDRVAIVCPYEQQIAEDEVNDSNLFSLLQIPNPSVAALYEDALVYETGSAITSSGALTAYSGKKTGRSPLDKRIVQEPSSENDIWWGPVNKPMSPDVSHFVFAAVSFDFCFSHVFLRICRAARGCTRGPDPSHHAHRFCRLSPVACTIVHGRCAVSALPRVSVDWRSSMEHPRAT
jgi:hypothetical protein